MQTRGGWEQEVEVPVGAFNLVGTLAMPRGARAVVLFAHGSGSSRHSPRNRFVAGQLQGRGFGTLLLDLLTPEEENRDIITREYRFDIALLGIRLVAAADWLHHSWHVSKGALGCFGASTGAAAALTAAAERPQLVGAVVSRGGRPDLAPREVLENVRAPTLLIVGGHDEAVIELNEAAMAVLCCRKQLAIVRRASHLFEEPGALEQVADLAGDWFERHLTVGTAVQAQASASL